LSRVAQVDEFPKLLKESVGTGMTAGKSAANTYVWKTWITLGKEASTYMEQCYGRRTLGFSPKENICNTYDLICFNMN
jgi:hypothetical protein